MQMILNNGTDMSQQTVQTQISILRTRCRRFNAELKYGDCLSDDNQEIILFVYKKQIVNSHYETHQKGGSTERSQ